MSDQIADILYEVQHGHRCCEHVAERDARIAELEAWGKAIIAYTRHEDGCDLWSGPGSGTCECGLLRLTEQRRALLAPAEGSKR